MGCRFSKSCRFLSVVPYFSIHCSVGISRSSFYTWRGERAAWRDSQGSLSGRYAFSNNIFQSTQSVWAQSNGDQNASCPTHRRLRGERGVVPSILHATRHGGVHPGAFTHDVLDVLYTRYTESGCRRGGKTSPAMRPGPISHVETDERQGRLLENEAAALSAQMYTLNGLSFFSNLVGRMHDGAALPHARERAPFPPTS